jgi:ubiquitin-conjugating enzyme E2 Q
MTPVGVSRKKIMIPRAAVSTSRHTGAPAAAETQGRSKLRKTGKGSRYDPIPVDLEDENDAASDTTLEQDRALFEDDTDEDDDDDADYSRADAKPGKTVSLKRSFDLVLSKLKPTKSHPTSSTGFVPGKLDFSKLPMLKPPIWASPHTTKRLMKDFQTLVKSQAQKRPDEAFFFVDPERIENMYQWIVELHSFDPELPLTKDMKNRGIPSIVLELRFGNNYPLSPPFVRVIKPRFKAFMQGGGGHVTAGGAMCMEV